MDKVFNIISLVGWGFLLFHVGIPLFLDPIGFAQSDISLDLTVLRAVQLFQTLDIVLILIGKSKGSIVGAFFQILARNIISLYFMSEQGDRLKFAAVVIVWAMADINRYLYYLFKTNPLTGFLRYNSFIVLYPIGVFGEMRVINDYIQINAETLTDLHINFYRVIQGGIIFGLFFLYTYMLKARSKYYKSLKNSEEPEKVASEERKTQRSPRKQMKRD